MVFFVKKYLTSRSHSHNVYTDMATLQKRKSRGKTYWSIVESRRVNGKPRPVILAYLGRAEDLLKRLSEGIPQSVKVIAMALSLCCFK